MNRAKKALTVGLISDTHGLLRPEALDALRGADLLVHAGDIGSPTILAELGKLAPVTAVRGNNDVAEWAQQLPLQSTLTVGAVRVHVVHELLHLKSQTLAPGVGAVICGHSHRPAIERKEGVLYINPGSAGPRRFKLPITVALLHVDGGGLDAEIIVLS